MDKLEEDEEIFESTEDMFKRFEEEDLAWEKEHPIRANIRKFFDEYFPKGIGGKRAYYAIQDPLEILRSWKYDIRHAWQRLSRGWDDTATWHVGYYLSKILPPIIRQLKEEGHGVPLSMYEGAEEFPFSEKQLGSIDKDGKYIETDEDKLALEKWNKILDEIADGFESYIKFDEKILLPKEYEKDEDYQKFMKALDLLKKYYQDLWD